MLLGSASCSKQPEKNDSKEITFEVLTAQNNFTLENSAKTFNRDSDLTFCDSVDMLLPSSIYGVEPTALRDSIISLAFDTIGTDYQTLIKADAQKFASYSGFGVKDFPNHYANLAEPDSYHLLRGYLASLTPNMLSYCVFDESYLAGAAHGMSSRYYINYVMSDNKILQLKDIFTPEGLKALPPLIQKEADGMAGVIGEVTIIDLPSRDNFYISPAGEIVFVYQQGEVASYAQSFIWIAFYPYELSQYMTKAGLKMFNLQDLD